MCDITYHSDVQKSNAFTTCKWQRFFKLIYSLSPLRQISLSRNHRHSRRRVNDGSSKKSWKPASWRYSLYWRVCWRLLPMRCGPWSARPCNTLQHAATICQRAIHVSVILQHIAAHCNTMQHNATQCNSLQHAATQQFCQRTVDYAHPCNTLQNTETHWNTLQHTSLASTMLTYAHPCNALQHTATQLFSLTMLTWAHVGLVQETC